jgi:tRNA threonylcarbamoyladenosine biosynthesis protein TsaB
MAVMLHIDTAQATAMVAISRDGQIIAAAINPQQREHATWLHATIEQLMNDAEIPWKQIAAIAVAAGPGSYTGLRVGLAAAKGFSFALGIPLIMVDSLQVMADAMQQAMPEMNPQSVLVPMIDARRMEVFTACFDAAAQPIEAAHALIIAADSFERFGKRPLYLAGDGAAKCVPILQANISMLHIPDAPLDAFVQRSVAMFLQQQFTSLVDANPTYVKGFHFST